MRWLSRLLALAFFAGAAACGWLYWFSQHAFTPPTMPFEFTVKQGAGLKVTSRQLAAQGLFPEGESLWIVARLLGKAPTVQAGTYRLEGPVTPLELLDKLARGDVVLAEVRFIEGTTFRQWLAVLATQSRLRPTLGGKTQADVAKLLESPTESPEGWLFPDTYRYAPGITDLDLLKLAHARMKRRLDDAWTNRAADVHVKTAYEMLIMA